MLTIILFLTLIGGPFAVAEIRAHILRAEIEQGQRVRCVRAETDLNMWEKDL